MRVSKFSILILLISCNASDIHTKAVSKEAVTPVKTPVQLSYYKCDYSRQQFDTILSSGDKHTTTEIWGVNKSDISTFPSIKTLNIDTALITKMAAAHLRKRFTDISILSSECKLERINEDTANQRNWFIDVTFLYDKRGYYQKVPALPDGRIILSNNE